MTTLWLIDTLRKGPWHIAVNPYGYYPSDSTHLSREKLFYRSTCCELKRRGSRSGVDWWLGSLNEPREPICEECIVKAAIAALED
jgi:hypothetical protein